MKSKQVTEQEQMRLQVVDLELKARYWKAQFEIRHFTMEAEKLQEEYNKYLSSMQEKNKKLQEEFEAQLETLKAEEVN